MKKNPQMPSARRIIGMVVGVIIIGEGLDRARIETQLHR